VTRAEGGGRTAPEFPGLEDNAASDATLPTVLYSVIIKSVGSYARSRRVIVTIAFAQT
jgi:hypothetical protein